jgi:hypothetical protein
MLVLWGVAPAAALAATIVALVAAALFISSIMEPVLRRRLLALLNAAELRLISPAGSLAFLQRT